GPDATARVRATGGGAGAPGVGRVGAGAAGVLIVTTLRYHGVQARLARDGDPPTGTAVALADAVVADRGANARLSRDDLPSPLEGDALLVSGFALFQEGSRDAALAALETFEGVWTAVDLASPNLARADFDARIVFATRAEAKAVPRLENRF